MAYEQKNNSGSLFKNDKKVEGDKQPLYKGKCMIDGVMKEIGAWMQTSDRGTKYMSLRFQDEYKPQESAPAPAPIPIHVPIPAPLGTTTTTTYDTSYNTPNDNDLQF